MDVLHTGMLIRVSILVVAFCMLVILAAIAARSARRRAAQHHRDSGTNQRHRPADLRRIRRDPGTARRIDAGACTYADTGNLSRAA